ncbi:hypothetical protein DFJ58DRAFT_730748 [Suillus subalutaceus]|uniref:uncharacterized protein n=1 Tax=Suillus subalutaceus TaxID=48586 RepID=UPI001B882E85|nr:uncharacterized protein DFJ58DRAFT_730748 [Suillus subalutaceus]KAG1845683.1 hypothetical protein DFJ58DRAFT_730748 [Suillus subalutaceus]
MVNWNDPDLEAKLGILLVQLLYVILGLYGWEYIRSSYMEIALLRRQLPFRWPLLSYITARFSFLIAIILHAIQSSPFYTSVDCQSECFVDLIFADEIYLDLGMNFAVIFWTNVAIGCSTTNLMIRTHAHNYLSYYLDLMIYMQVADLEDQLPAAPLLVLLSLGHWTLLTLFLATARASPINGVCVINFVNPVYTSAMIIYGTHIAFMIHGYVMISTPGVAMLYDLALLIFTVVGLLRMPSSSTLWKTLVKQGVIYFIFNFLANLIFLVLKRLNLNSIMNAIFGMPAACICTIASNQVVLSLLRPSSNYESDSPSSGKVHPLTSNLTVRVPW